MLEIRQRWTSLSRAALWIAAAVQLASLAACGGGGGYGGGGTMAAPGTPPSKLFAAQAGYPGISSFVNPDTSGVGVIGDRFFYGSGQSINALQSLSLDTMNDRLYVGNNTTVLVYEGASMASSIISPNRTITGIGDAGSVFIDTTNNRLYVGDRSVGVEVFDAADMANGMMTPSRSITGPFGTTFQISGVAVDAGKNILYVANSTLTPAASQQITLFTVSTVNGTATVKATITPIDGMHNNLSVAGVALDSTNDRLYVAGPSPTVLVFDSVSTLTSGSQTATRTITLPAQVQNLAIDPAADRLYAVALSGSAIYIVEGAHTATTSATVKTITPVYGPFTAVAVSP